MVRKNSKVSRIKFERIAMVSIIVALGISVSANFYLLQSSPADQLSLITPDVASETDLSTVGFIQVEPVAAVTEEGQGLVALRTGCLEVVANTDVHQAESIINGLQGIVAERPNTHDLMRDSFESLNMEVLMVKVVDLKEGNYIGRILLRQENTILSLDSKPSDGIALATRTNAPIYFNETLFDQNSRTYC